jgi:4-alpha-glucanotransferase
MRFERAGGVLCHPTSFPSPYGIGDLGPGAYDFVNWLVSARQGLWQVLPLSPTGYGDSPYQSFSAFAGNPNLISPDQLCLSGLLPAETLDQIPVFPPRRVDFGAVVPYKTELFRRSFEYFQARGTADQCAAFEHFRKANAAWVEDYGFFMALKAHFGGGSWQDWPRAVRVREPGVVDKYRQELGSEITYQVYLQWVFAEQWSAIKSYANSNRIRIIGDIPIFVAEDSADVWSHPEQFQLDKNGRPTVIAGVPPDNFSASGQRWGNPHYNWDVMAGNGYHWWIDRIRKTLETVDILRIDHFRGFEGYWAVPAKEKTAIKGKWVKGPGEALFKAIEGALGDLPIIAEDLGVITPEVDALRNEFDFPGMKVLQFGFALDNDAKYLPHSFERNYVVYPGTHDNNTVTGWFNEQIRTPQEKWNALRYMKSDGTDLAWDFIRAAWASVCDMAVTLLQDVMGLGAEGRMNFPSTTSGNWQWRYTHEMLTDNLRARLLELTMLYGRAAPVAEDT